jgi:hypothetical protein
MKRLIFKIRCQKASWKDRKNKPCRNKSRRRTKEIQRIADEMGILK